MALLKVNSTSLTAVANALRTANSTNSQLAFPAGFVSAIESLASGGGVQLTCGVQLISQADDFTLNNLPFTPTNGLMLLIKRSTTKGMLVNAVSDPIGMEPPLYGSYANPNSGLMTNVNTDNFTFSQNSAAYTTPSTFNLYGTYFYLFWRTEEAQP